MFSTNIQNNVGMWRMMTCFTITGEILTSKIKQKKESKYTLIKMKAEERIIIMKSSPILNKSKSKNRRSVPQHNNGFI
jgi:hypothetical protein